MGLDMYLSTRLHVRNSETDLNKQILAVTKMPTNIEVSSVTFEVMYWRKANQIHSWFVNNVQDGTDDCGTYEVELDKLQELVDVCDQVLNDHSLAESLLPTSSGFFFGDTAYDEWYFKDLRETRDRIREVLDDPAFSNLTFEYTASW